MRDNFVRTELFPFLDFFEILLTIMHQYVTISDDRDCEHVVGVHRRTLNNGPDSVTYGLSWTLSRISSVGLGQEGPKVLVCVPGGGRRDTPSMVRILGVPQSLIMGRGGPLTETSSGPRA